MNPHICMLRQIKGIISGQIVYNDKAYNNEQGRQKNLWGPGQNYIWDPYGIIFKQRRLKTGGQYSKVLRIPLNQALMPYTCPNVDRALLNFRLFLKLGPLVGLGPRASCPLCPPPVGGPDYECLYVVTFFLVNFVFFKVVLTPGLHSNHTSCFYFRQISKIHAKCCLEIKETNARN